MYVIVEYTKTAIGKLARNAMKFKSVPSYKGRSVVPRFGAGMTLWSKVFGQKSN
jgi:hypothetical protein